MQHGEKRKIEVRGRRRIRLLATLTVGVVLGTTIAASPQRGVGGTVAHLWSHLQPLTDARYYTKGRSTRTRPRSPRTGASPEQRAGRSGLHDGRHAERGARLLRVPREDGHHHVDVDRIRLHPHVRQGAGRSRGRPLEPVAVQLDVTARTTHNLQRLLQFGNSRARIQLKCRAGAEERDELEHHLDPRGERGRPGSHRLGASHWTGSGSRPERTR